VEDLKILYWQAVPFPFGPPVANSRIFKLAEGTLLDSFESHFTLNVPMMDSKTFKVGIIIGSQRVVRVGPQVANFVLDAINRHKASIDTTLQPQTTLDLIDIATHNLPIFDESGIPNKIKSPEEYEHEHTRVWARRIAGFDAFDFVSAQRNWGIPAELKNVIDYLFHEWKVSPPRLSRTVGTAVNNAQGS
jgi:NAD(P)H-dependent FMN reductase